MKNFSFKKLFENNRFVLIFSVVAAILSWILVAMTTGPTTSQYISNVPVRMDLQTENLQLVNLSVVGTVDATVTVLVEGDRSVVGNLTAEDIVVTPRVTGITEPDTYSLTLASPGQTEGYTVKSISPSTIDVRLDENTSKQLELDNDIRGLSVPPDYLYDRITVSPGSITVRGPASEVAKVDKAVAVLELTDTLTGTFNDEAPIVLRDVAGNDLSLEEHHLSLNANEATITIPVLLTKELSLEVAFTNIPQGFPEDTLRSYMYMSEETLLVAGPVAAIENINSMLLGTINLHSLADEGNTFPFSITLDSDQYRNINQVNNVSVSFDSDGWSSVVLSGISNIVTYNEPIGYEVEVLQTYMSPIEFVGEASIIEELTSDDIVVEVNLAEQGELTVGDRYFPVKVSAPDKGMVWAHGDHSVIIQVTKLPDPEESQQP